MPDFEDCRHRVMAIRCALSASLIDNVNGSTVETVGRGSGDDPEVTTGGTAEAVTTTVHSGASAGAGRPGRIEDIVVTAGNCYHLIRFVGTGPAARRVLSGWLDRTLGNLAIAQRALRAIARTIAVS